MSLKPAPPRVDEHGTTILTIDGKDYWQRECPSYQTKHKPHVWKAYFFETTPKGNNAYCPGEGTTPDYPNPNPYVEAWYRYTSYTPKVKKDYSEDAQNFPHSNPITVTEARKIAYDMHKGQKDKAGEDYRLHLNAVQKGVVVLGGSEEEQIAALFHDAVEDHHTTYALLKKINVTDSTLVMIEAVSKRSNEEQSKYLTRVKLAGETIPESLKGIINVNMINTARTKAGACRVKLADLFHNTRHDRIQALRDNNRGYVADRLLKKYRPSLAALMLELGLIITEDEQKIATKPQGSSWGGAYTPKSTSTPTKTKTTSNHPRWEDTPKPIASTPEKHAPTQPFVVLSKFLRPGDWRKGWNAPVATISKISDTSTEITLLNGETFEESSYAQIEVYSPNQWWHDVDLFPDFTSEQIEEFDLAVAEFIDESTVEYTDEPKNLLDDVLADDALFEDPISPESTEEILKWWDDNHGKV